MFSKFGYYYHIFRKLQVLGECGLGGPASVVSSLVCVVLQREATLHGNVASRESLLVGRTTVGLHAVEIHLGIQWYTMSDSMREVAGVTMINTPPSSFGDGNYYCMVGFFVAPTDSSGPKKQRTVLTYDREDAVSSPVRKRQLANTSPKQTTASPFRPRHGSHQQLSPAADPSGSYDGDMRGYSVPTANRPPADTATPAIPQSSALLASSVSPLERLPARQTLHVAQDRLIAEQVQETELAKRKAGHR